MDDMEWLRRKWEAAWAEELRLLALAKEKARADGKEPFDFAALCRLYDPSSELSSTGKLYDPAGTAAALERRYYIDYPKVMTIAEFAETLERLRPFR
jgi:hypothetical protein